MTEHHDHPELRWQAQAACAGQDPTPWFPGSGTPADADVAYATCNFCPVQTDCLEYAIANRIDHGIWGGQSERARRRITRQRQANTPSPRP